MTCLTAGALGGEELDEALPRVGVALPLFGGQSAHAPSARMTKRMTCLTWIRIVSSREEPAVRLSFRREVYDLRNLGVLTCFDSEVPRVATAPLGMTIAHWANRPPVAI